MQKVLKEIALRSSPGLLANAVSRGKWKFAPHLKLLDDILSRGMESGRKLIVNMPPRHGKSELISKYYPFWHLLNFPGKRIMLCSYSASFAEMWGRKVRELINEHGAEYGVEVSRTQKAAGNFSIAGYGGGMSCFGAGGSITGRGADLLIIDDPVKNDAEAHSAVYREKIWEWFRATVMTRLEPGGSVVIVMTRWHEDDLCGRILAGERVFTPQEKEAQNGWLWISIPAKAGDNDILGRKRGEPLWKERFPRGELERIRSRIGGYWFASLYQQKPVPAGGGIFKKEHFRYFSEKNDLYILNGGKTSIEKKRNCSIYAVMDLAAGLSETSDYTVVLVFARTPRGHTLVLDVIRKRFNASEHMGLIEAAIKRWAPSVIGIESVQYQISLVQSAMKKGYPVVKLTPDKDKVSRALPAAARCESGEVFFRQGASWLENFESELLAFPRGKHDDQVDAFAYTVYLLQPASSSMPKGISKEKVFKGKISHGF